MARGGKSEIALQGLYLSSGRLYDEHELVKGMHLRWSFNADMGFPKNGFTIQRMSGLPQDLSSTLSHRMRTRPVQVEWSTHINLPLNRNEALERLNAGSSSAVLTTKFSNAADDLMEVINRLKAPPASDHMYDRRLETPTHSGLKSGLRLMDILLMASVDPYIARMLGLYVIHQEASHVDKAVYRITGHWDDLSYPVEEVSFEHTSISQGHQSLQFGALKVISVNRTIGVPSSDGDDIHSKHLLIYGDANPAVKIYLDHPVEELVIDYQLSERSGSWDIRIDREVGSGITDDGTGVLRIHRPGNPFQRIEFALVPGSRWRIFRITHRKKTTPIGDVIAYTIVDPTKTQDVPTPVITDLSNQQMPAILDKNGMVNNKISQTEVAALVPLPRPDVMDLPEGTSYHQILPVISAAHYPVRTLLGRARNRVNPQTILNVENGVFSPSLYRERATDIVLPELLGLWSFNGDFQNHKDGTKPRLLGSPKFTKDTNGESISQFSVRLNGKDAIELYNQPHLKEIGDRFTLEATIKIDRRNGRASTLIGNTYRTGFWWGLIKQADGNYKPRLWIKNRSFDADGAVPRDSWVRISVVYNGETVMFHYSSATYAIPEAPKEAALGRVNLSSGHVVIGAENGSSAAALDMPFTGSLMDVAIWQRPIHPSESRHLRSKWLSFLGEQQQLAAMVFRDKTCYGLSTRRDQVLIQKTQSILALSYSFSIYLWVWASSSNEAYTTLVGNNYNVCFWVGLRKQGDQFIFRVWINGRAFEAIGRFPAEQWTHLGLAYDGSLLQLYINGILDKAHRAALGPLNANDAPIALGSDIVSTVAADQFRFNGLVHDIQFWRTAVTAMEWRRKISAVQHVDRFLSNGRYRYFAKGIDLFGRTSPWSSFKEIRAQAVPEYGSPMNLNARFLTISGTLSSVTEIYDEEGVKQQYQFRTTVSYNESLAASMVGYDITVLRDVQFQVPMDPEDDDYSPGASEMLSRKGEQLFEIVSVSPYETDDSQLATDFTVLAAAFEQLVPQPGDTLSIPLDFYYQLDWSWTGSQQLYYAEIDKFRLHRLQGHLNEISGTITLLETLADNRFRIRLKRTIAIAPDELVEQKCLIGPHMFVIESHNTGANPEFTIRYDSLPAVTPANHDLLRITLQDTASTYIEYHKKEAWRFDRVEIPLEDSAPISCATSQTVRVLDMEGVSESDIISDTPNPSVDERKELLTQGVDWIPRSRVYKLSFPNFERPADYTPLSPSQYIPGALVFYDSHPDRNRWRSFYVLWHQWKGTSELVVYVTPGEKDEPEPQILLSSALPARFYLGKRYTYIGDLKRPPVFSKSPTIPFQLALTASDGSRVQSEISRWATVIAVNRKRPPMAPRPRATILDKADYYEKCQVEVRWNRLPGKRVLFKLYRANDSAIYTRDLEQRRSRQGHYKGMQPAAVFQDDTDFTAWLATQSGAVPSQMFPDKGSSQWQQQTVYWRSWADRFYPALTDDELDAIASRAGNEKAFALVRAKPIDGNSYVDQVNGVIKNRYYYRLRAQNEALAESTLWSPVSEAVVPQVVTAPKQPVFTKVEAGDRKITLHWALNWESDFKEYVLYRAESKEELKDLRWWKTSLDTRIIAVIPDPRIKVSDRGLTIPAEVSISSISGVFVADEFDADAYPPQIQSGALNYWNPSPGDSAQTASSFIVSDGTTAHRIEDLRRIADGKAVVVVYHDEAGEVQTLRYTHNLLPYQDMGLQGLKEYYYRLVGVNYYDKKAVSLEIKKAVAIDNSVPEAPEWINAEWVKVSESGDILPITSSSGSHAIQLNWQTAMDNIDQLKIESKGKLGNWKDVSGWLNREIVEIVDRSPNLEALNTYRIVVRNYAGRANIVFEFMYVEPTNAIIT